MAIDLTSTALRDDPDPRGTDKYGFIPLVVELPDSDHEEEMGASAEDGGDEGGEPALIEPTSILADFPRGSLADEDDDDAYQALTQDEADGLSPGEAEDLIEYMRPLSPEEAEVARDPLLKDMWWVDDPAHVDDLLRAGKTDRGIDNYLQDTSYGETMNPEERAERNDVDNLRGWGNELRLRRRARKMRRRQRWAARHAPGMLPGAVPGTALTAAPPAFDAAYAAAHAPASAPAPVPYAQPYAQPYSQPYSQPYAQAAPAPYIPPYGQPAPQAQPYAPASTYVPTYLVGRAASESVRRGLITKMVVEHANWLADMDKKAGVKVRPRDYYENVAKLWTIDKLKRDAVTTSGGAQQADVGLVARRAHALLTSTDKQRKRFSSALGVSVDMGGWNPFKAAKSAVKSAVKSVSKAASTTARVAYKQGKRAVLTPAKYGYRGVKYVGKKIADVALAPLRAIVRKYTGPMVSRRANLLAKQRGAAKPSPADVASAKNWAKNFIRAKAGKYAGPVVSLMAGDPEYGIRTVDISMNGDDLVGLSAGDASIIALGPVGLALLLAKVVKMSSSSAPPPEPGSEAAAAEAAAAEASAAEEAAAEEDPGAYDEGAPGDDAYADEAQGWGVPRRRVTVESLSRMSPSRRARTQRMIRAGKLQLG